MIRASVDLDDGDEAILRRLQQTTGRSQSERLRDGLRALAGEEPRPHPRPQSIGTGDWVTEGGRHWDADDLARPRGIGGAPASEVDPT